MDLRETLVRIPIENGFLEGNLTLTRPSRGLVVFAHGSGSSRHSPRNVYVAKVLQEASLCTLLLDLLTREEEIQDQRDGSLRFDIDLLATRLERVTEWVRQDAELRELRVGYFGASTGAAAAFKAAARLPNLVYAVVSRGGRPDLAGEALPLIKAPTLLILGSEDHQVIQLNWEAAKRMRAETQWVEVPGAGHLFEEPGALAEVARHAAVWFSRHLKPPDDDY